MNILLKLAARLEEIRHSLKRALNRFVSSSKNSGNPVTLEEFLKLYLLSSFGLTT